MGWWKLRSLSACTSKYIKRIQFDQVSATFSDLCTRSSLNSPEVPEFNLPHLRYLVVANMEATFVKDDVSILGELGDVRFWNTAIDGIAPPKLMQLVAEADIIYCWFASFHALLPILAASAFNKPVIVVSGGYDSAYVPEIGYGNAGHAFKKYLSGFLLDQASAIIVNSAFSAGDLLKFRPDAESKLFNIPHRINPKMPVQKPDRQPKLLLTVARLNPMNYRRKKMELIKQIAAALPEYEVVHIGMTDDELTDQLHENMPPNMRSVGFVSDDELWMWYHRAGGLLVPSWHEGFGVTAAEAPAAGCLPFISGAGAQREVTQGYAVEIGTDEVSDWVNAIKSALPVPEERRIAMQKAMMESYTGDGRKSGIIRAIRYVLDH